MRVLVTGAGGMLGRDLVDALVARGHEVLALGRSELDVTEADACQDVIGDFSPRTVVNCAAWTDVDGAEGDEAAALLVNETGARNVAEAAERAHADVVYVSSDYVFDGSQRTPYLESAATHPISAYGRTKLAGEFATEAATERHLIVRTSWLFGIRGPNFVETMLRLAGERDEVLVVADQVGTPTYTRHLAMGLVGLIEAGESGLHHLSAAGQCSWFDFAQEIFDLAGRQCRVMAGTTDMLGRPAPRPPFSVLESERSPRRQLPDWRQGLRQYMGERSSVRG